MFSFQQVRRTNGHTHNIRTYRSASQTITKYHPQSLGGEILGFCGGRVDARDGAESIQLGPSPLQEELAPCESLGLQVSSNRAVN